MQVITAFYLLCSAIVLVGAGIAVYGDRKNEPFCLMTGPAIMAIGLVIIIYTACLYQYELRYRSLNYGLGMGQNVRRRKVRYVICTR